MRNAVAECGMRMWLWLRNADEDEDRQPHCGCGCGMRIEYEPAFNLSFSRQFNTHCMASCCPVKPQNLLHSGKPAMSGSSCSALGCISRR